MIRHTLLRQAAWLVVGRLMAAALQAVSFAVLARTSDVRAFGTVMTVIATWTALGAFFDLGMGTLIIRERAVGATDAQITHILRINALTNLAVLLMSATSLATLAIATDSATLFNCLPLALWFASEKNGQVWLGFATADDKAHLATLSLLIRRGGALLLFTILLHALEPALAFALASAGASTTGNLLIRAMIAHSLDRSTSSEISTRMLLAKARPFYANSLASQMRNFDLVVVQSLASPVAAAAFAIPSRLLSPLRLAASAAAPSILSSAAAEGSGLRSAIRLSLIIQFTMTAFLTLVAFTAQFSVTAVLGMAYSDAILPVQISCMGLIFAIAVTLQTAILQGAGWEQYAGKLSMIMAPISLAAIGAGASTGGAVGAAWGLTGGFVLHAALLAPPIYRTSTSLGGKDDDLY